MSSEDTIAEPRHKTKATATFQEIWKTGPQGETLCVLVNNEYQRAVVMYRRPSDTIGYTSRNPADNLHHLLEFQRQDGQLGHYPSNWSYPIDIINEAITYFELTGERSPMIIWHDDGVAE
tara:strand:+ start:306 stop:665 length:360 start_codon:yes stop_codon:yes gene_type:complete